MTISQADARSTERPEITVSVGIARACKAVALIAVLLLAAVWGIQSWWGGWPVRIAWLVSAGAIAAILAGALGLVVLARGATVRDSDPARTVRAYALGMVGHLAIQAAALLGGLGLAIGISDTSEKFSSVAAFGLTFAAFAGTLSVLGSAAISRFLRVRSQSEVDPRPPVARDSVLGAVPEGVETDHEAVLPMKRTSRALALLFALLFCAIPLSAQAPGHTAEQAADHAQAGHGHGGEPRGTMEMESGEFFLEQFLHLVPHATGTQWDWQDAGKLEAWYEFYDVNLFQLLALALILLAFLPVVFSDSLGKSNVIVRVLRGWVHWLRDEVVYKTMGEEEGRRFLPFFVYLFFFVLFMNLMGLVPGAVTSTATIFVTGALALVTLTIMVGGGMLRQGPVDYLKNLVPGGIPGWLLPLMAFVEVIGLIVKPFALMLRLFANMLAGHLLIYSFIGMIFVFSQLLDLSAVSWLPAILTTAMAVFINIIESFVVVLQAYIFVFLSVMFVQDSLHPAH